ncbi:Alpha/Beta hydrolase protein [Lyophyllum atratum]|nr:Alpha/Beta hydrolase protein [Lyophyllum atratum]
MTEVVKLPSGISLEVEIAPPSAMAESVKLAICLHPWSWLGGQKDDPVLLSLADHLTAENYYVLRYNSRGVGRSKGWSSFTGFSEAEDLEELATWALQKISSIESLVLIGYSHGSLIASLHPVIPTIKTSHILISYPLGPRGWLTLFNTSTYSAKLKELIRNVDSNVLIVYGDQDEFTVVSKYKDWRENLEEESGGGRLRVVEIPGGSHFWRGRSGQQLNEQIRGWLP